MITGQVISEKTLLDDKLVVEKAEVEVNENKFTRLRVKRQDAVAVLVVNTDTNKVILTRQYRYPIHEKTVSNILEIVAGKVDEGEEPERTAIREVEEEIGYHIKPEHLKFLFTCFVSPGYSSESFIIYYAQVTDTDRVSKGGGLASENEQIEVVEMDIIEFNEHIKKAQFKDAKTYIAGMFLTLHNILP
jgi:nudix-type nucleoside diphosphatase (YffH/AdpP family)